ncbi:MAG: HlyD family efflux transporter periplasmic adaptor subunit [Bacteroidota bacterium]
MPDQENNLNIFSEDIQEVVAKLPSWPIRWGISIISGTLGMLILGTWFIKYPDSIPCRIVLTTEFEPVDLVSNTSGKVALMVRETDTISRGEVLAYIANATRYEDYLRLRNILEQFQEILSRNFQPQDLYIEEYLQLGELQADYLLLLNRIKTYQITQDVAIRESQILSINKRIDLYQKINQQLAQQKGNQAKELHLIAQKYATDQELFSEGIIAKAVFDQSQLAYLQAQRAFESSENTLMGNEINIAQLKAQQVELSLGKIQAQDQFRNDIFSAYRQLESKVQLWQERYLIIAPFEGQISLRGFLNDEQFIMAGAVVMTIVPFSQHIYGQAQMPISGSGKVEIGQRVNIKLDNFPATEYGMIYGEVHAISAIPQDNIYRVKVGLQKGLQTSFRRQLPFKQQLTGVAEIITADLSVLDRIFRQFRSIVQQSKN